jgi:hypothetical protein
MIGHGARLLTLAAALVVAACSGAPAQTPQPTTRTTPYSGWVSFGTAWGADTWRLTGLQPATWGTGAATDNATFGVQERFVAVGETTGGVPPSTTFTWTIDGAVVQTVPGHASGVFISYVAYTIEPGALAPGTHRVQLNWYEGSTARNAYGDVTITP